MSNLLKPKTGDEYITIGGQPVRVADLAGERRGSFFYPASCPTAGFQVRVVQPTRGELRQSLVAARNTAPRPVAALDATDWK